MSPSHTCLISPTAPIWAVRRPTPSSMRRRASARPSSWGMETTTGLLMIASTDLGAARARHSPARRKWSRFGRALRRGPEA